MDNVIVEFQHVSKIYRIEEVMLQAVHNASFSIQKGEFAAVSGPSGSGKSTILNLIGLIDLPTEGKIILNNCDIYAGKESVLEKEKISGSFERFLTDMRRKNVGFIFQTFNLIPVLNVEENVALPLSLGKNGNTDDMSKTECAGWVDFLIERVGLSDWKKHKPAELSGGQRQRVAIARALVTKAPVILADEPTANLDSKNGDQILDLMKKLNQETGTTFIFSTHDEKIVNMSNHVIKLKDGIIQEQIYS